MVETVIKSDKKKTIIKYIRVAKHQYESVLSNAGNNLFPDREIADILIKQSIYMISMYINEVMVLCFRNRDAFKRMLEDCDAPDVVITIDEIWLICKWIRNGFTHDPLYPNWRILNKKDLKKTFTFSSGLTLVPQALNGNPIAFHDFGGADGLFCLCDDLIDNMEMLAQSSCAADIGL